MNNLYYYAVKKKTIKKIITLIECVDEFNYLGIIINKHLKWNSHVNKIGNKISQTIGVIIKLKTLNTTINIIDHLQFSHSLT